MDDPGEATSMPSKTKVVVTTTIFMVITLIVTILRAVSRRLCEVHFTCEDLLALLAVLMFWATCGVQIAAAVLAEQIPYYTDPRYSYYAELTWISNVLYVPCISLVNLSILWLLRRIFRLSNLYPVITGMIFVQLAWCVTTLVGWILACHPVPVYWVVDMPGHCMKFGYFWLAMGIFETIIDMIIFALPFFELVKLKMTWTKKSLLLVLFSIGGVSVVTQICRVKYTYDGATGLLDSIWIYVHTGTAILCACLPQLRPLLALIPWYNYSSALRSFKGPSSSEHSQLDKGDATTGSRRSYPARSGQGSVRALLEPQVWTITRQDSLASTQGALDQTPSIEDEQWIALHDTESGVS